MMKKRLRDVVDSLDYTELLKMREDLEAGGHHLKSFLSEQLKCREREHATICSVCTNNINPDSPTTYTLLFGPSDFKKKATFCGKDCLLYFLGKTEDMKKGAMPKTMT